MNRGKRLCAGCGIGIFLLALGYFQGEGCAAGTEEQGLTYVTSSWLQELQQVQEQFRDGFFFSSSILGYGTYADLVSSSQNPGNEFMDLADRSAVLELRPDFRFALEKVDFSIKPRVKLQQTSWLVENAENEGRANSSETEWSVNEYLLRLQVTDSLFASWGWENFQWGPSYLTSPSNPFFTQNGRLQPREEVKGLDLARLVWVPDDDWSLSFIANPSDGAAELDDFSKKYGIKLDYMADRYYLTTIASFTENQGDAGRKLGGVIGWTASDALLLYAEGSVQQGNSMLHPVSCSSPLGLCMEATEEDAAALASRILVGSSYTFDTLVGGATLVTEYLYNSAGYGDEEAHIYSTLRDRASVLYRQNTKLRGFASSVLGNLADTGSEFLRRNYLFVQLRKDDIYDRVDVSLSCIENLDDLSLRLLPVVDVTLNDHMILFLDGMANFGAADTEYGSLYHLQIMAGIQYIF